jgi:asparagine synthase (glutamine-hydrolysing)
VANFLIVVDPDRARRRACLRAAAEVLEALPGMRIARCERGDFAASWVSAERGPCSVDVDDNGTGIVWGDAFGDDGVPITGAGLRHAWSSVAARLPPSWDGFHAAVSYSASQGIVVGVDRLGLFPLYYWSAAQIVLVAASPAAFRVHPSFTAAFNPVGACGILLTGGLVDGETLWRGVRRLAPGRLLAWSHHAGAREIVQYAMPLGVPRAAGSFESDVACMDAALDRAVMGQLKAQHSIGLLLSGGRDSRLVAGILRRHGQVPKALTLGESTDHEVRCAAAVTATLGFPHDVVADPLEDVEALVSRHLRLEHLSNGMSNFHTWGMIPLVTTLGDRLLSGYLLDALIGGTWRRLAPAGTTESDGVERFLMTVMSYGVAPERLRRLLRPEAFGDAVDDVLDRVRRGFGALPGEAHDRAWQYLLLHRGRHHAGSAFWRLTMGAWPIVVLLGAGLTDVAASLPVETLVGRRAEDALLLSRFPALARLPLDRNSDDTTPLLPSTAQRLRRRISERAPLVQRVLTPPGERRRYYRLYDINSGIWQTIRRLAEPARSGVGDLLRLDELNALLPPPGARIDLKDPIIDSNGLKALLGFLIWCQRHA